MLEVIKRLQAVLPERQQTSREEIANTFSHGLGLLVAILGTPFMIIYAMQLGSAKFTIGVTVFSATMIFLYLSSTLYHAVPKGRYKRAFQVVDHSAIFLLIAGTYTPFTLGVLNGVWGWSIFGIVWGLATVGVTLKAIYGSSYQFLFVCLYLLMGWLVVIAIEPMLERVPTAGLLWLLAGGLSYTMGVAFFVTDSVIKYGHFIWHLFVIAGTGCHYFAVLWYAA